MTRPEELDLEGVLARLEARGLGPATVPFVHRAVLAHVEEHGEGTMGLDDLLLRLLAGERREAAYLLVEEAGAWLRELPGAEEALAARWRAEGCRPGAPGYGEARRRAVRAALEEPAAHPYGWGCAGLDERVVEYPWVFDRLSRIHPPGASALDAGSTLNHPHVLARWRERGFGPLSIVTLRYEGGAEVSDAFRYEFADLRALPYRDGWFRTALCISTLEHVGMDNRLYGAGGTRAADPAREARAALDELRRVLSPGGRLLLSVPFGAPSDRGWQRIFGLEELEEIRAAPGWRGSSLRVFRAGAEGWAETDPRGARDAGYNDPRPGGLRDAPAWVAAAEAVALLELEKG